MKLNFFSNKKSILILLFLVQVITVQHSNASTEITQNISTYISEHKKVLITVVAIALGMSLNHYFWSEDANTRQTELQLTCLNSSSDTSPIFLFAHGVDPRSSASICQPTVYIENGTIDGICYTFCFQDSFRNLNFGQKRDCDLLANAYDQVHRKHPNSDIVIVGISRGASTIINTMASHKELNWAPVKAIILESPYEHVESLAEHIASSYLFFLPFSKHIMRGLLNKLPGYNPHGIQTIDMIEEIPQHIPLFVGYSKADKTVSPKGTCEIITKLKSTGKIVRSWAANSGRHSTLGSQSAYAEEVRNFLHNHLAKKI